jgi:hypothetical protein
MPSNKTPKTRAQERESRNKTPKNEDPHALNSLLPLVAKGIQTLENQRGILKILELLEWNSERTSINPTLLKLPIVLRIRLSLRMDQG